MFRSVTTEALVLRRQRQGEYHKNLTLLTPDLGLVYATAYGAYKMRSRLRMGSEPFTLTRAYLYHNPVRKSYTLTDLEILQTFEGLTVDLSRVAAASLWAEVAIRSYAAGEVSDMLFRLFLGCLRVLELAAEREQQYVTLQFLWRFLTLAGYQPDVSSCGSCGAAFGESSGTVYDPRSNSLVCATCGGASGVRLPAGARRYLQASSALGLEQAVALRLEGSSMKALRETLLGMVQGVLEFELASVRMMGMAQ